MAHQGLDDSSIKIAVADSENQRRSVKASSTSGGSGGTVELPTSTKNESARPQKERAQPVDEPQSTGPDSYTPPTLDVR